MKQKHKKTSCQLFVEQKLRLVLPHPSHGAGEWRGGHWLGPPVVSQCVFMDSDAKKSSLRRSSLTLHGSKEHFFPGNMMKAMEFHPQAGKPRKIQGFPADLLKIAPFFLPRNWLEQLCAQLQPQGQCRNTGGWISKL